MYIRALYIKGRDGVYSGVNGVIEYPALPVARQVNRLPVIPKEQSDNKRLATTAVNGGSN